MTIDNYGIPHSHFDFVSKAPIDFVDFRAFASLVIDGGEPIGGPKMVDLYMVHLDIIVDRHYGIIIKILICISICVYIYINMDIYIYIYVHMYICLYKYIYIIYIMVDRHVFIEYIYNRICV